MSTQQVFDKLPKAVQNKLLQYKNDYECTNHMPEVRRWAAAYCDGLHDAGLITESEKRMMFIFTTI